MTNQSPSRHGIHFTPADFQRLLHLREHKSARTAHLPRLSRGDRVADVVTSTVGSWRFIIIQSCLLSLWILLNVVGWVQHWDPYPFILLNLALSFQAAYTPQQPYCRGAVCWETRKHGFERKGDRATCHSTLSKRLMVTSNVACVKRCIVEAALIFRRLHTTKPSLRR